MPRRGAEASACQGLCDFCWLGVMPAAAAAAAALPLSHEGLHGDIMVMATAATAAPAAFCFSLAAGQRGNTWQRISSSQPCWRPLPLLISSSFWAATSFVAHQGVAEGAALFAVFPGPTVEVR